MRTYSDEVEVRTGPPPGSALGDWRLDGMPASLSESLSFEERPEDAPQQFLWRGRLWQVREVIAHWMEVGAWWVRRPEDAPGRSELATERQVWRVTAARGRAVATADDPGFGVFDLTFDGAAGAWRLAGSLD